MGFVEGRGVVKINKLGRCDENLLPLGRKKFNVKNQLFDKNEFTEMRMIIICSYDIFMCKKLMLCNES